ncbi:MAG: preprotein translocase subunit SecA [Candidatus Cloacimonas sp. SDB]|nr:MAG: preprotein translocase subunit SecA [Candidatus Cloacimonas sp. SDB]
MLKKFTAKLFGDRITREIKLIQPVIDEIIQIYPSLEQLSDDELRERVIEIKSDIQNNLKPLEEELADLQKQYQLEADESTKMNIGNEIDKKNATLKQDTQKILDDYLPEVFAIVKDTCRRLIGFEYEVRGHKAAWEMIPFDVQLIGGVVLHQGRIAEMATGEGKTLVATMPLFLNALLGRGVHLVTVNDYLAQRDSEWMKVIFEFHDLSVGCIIGGMDPETRKQAYDCDITYGTNSEFGFDYLRDNMAISEKRLVQRKHQYAIVDEVDSVLIDEARTPLIISGPVQESKNFYRELKPIILKLVSSQNTLVNNYLSDVRNMIKQQDYDALELGTRLLKIKRSAPKHKSFTKLLKDPELKKLVNDTESYYIRDKKLHTLDDDLLFVVEERQNSVELTDKGNELVAHKDPDLFILRQLDELLDEVDNNESYSAQQKISKKEEITSAFFDKNEKLHNIKQLLKAYTLFEKDNEYVVVDNKVMIVDEFTGRMMPGRRFSDGLHQALEAKENVTIEEATQTFATITLQNYFRMYDKIAGMTGTAVTEEGEFQEIYQLSVLEIPTNLPVTRIDHDDVIYLTKNDKYKAIISEIKYWNDKRKPVLVGTVSVEVSEILSRLLNRAGIKHNVLNAKFHEQEAEIIMGAGEPGAVTIATNMAGRGTDIKLGAGVVSEAKESYRDLSKNVNPQQPFGLPLDGLHVIGTERHESRRIDRQLRGRSGRQGDPGTSRFYLSLEDDLMRLFAPDKIAPMMMKLGFAEGEAIVHPWMTKAVERAQKRVEAYNFEVRKQLLKYDEVMNQQREVIYSYRKNVLKGYDLKFEIQEMIKDTIADLVESEIGSEQYYENWQLEGITNWLKHNLNVSLSENELKTDRMTVDVLTDIVIEHVMQAYDKREQEMTADQMREIERRVLLSVVDELWRDHLHEMDLLKEGISFRAYGQKDPLIEYKKESFHLFQELVGNINRNVTRKVFTTYIIAPEALKDFLEMADQKHSAASAFEKAKASMLAAQAQGRSAAPVPQEPPSGEKRKITPRVVEEKIGRNDPCPCGSGKKYKKCCGKLTNT